MPTRPPSRTGPCPCGSGRRYKHCCGAVDTADLPAQNGEAAPRDEFAAALALHEAGNIDEAERIYTSILAAQPASPHALHYLGVCCYQRGRHEEAARHIRAALAYDDREPMAYSNLGLVCKEQGRLDDALACFDKAVEQDPRNALAYNNRGLVLHELRRFDDAVKDFTQAASLRGDFAEAFNNLAKTLVAQDRTAEALANWDRAIAVQSDIAEIHSNRANALLGLGRFEEAVAGFRRAVALKPDIPSVRGDWLFAQMCCCDWADFEASCATVIAAIDRDEFATQPFTTLALPATPAQLQRCARAAVGHSWPPSLTPVWRGERYAHDRIRVAYVSGDFRDHPSAQLIAGLIEGHDRSSFEIIGIYIGPPTADEWRIRLEKAFDRFFDARPKSDEEIAALIRELEIDVVVDLMGHTKFARPGVFALRPAPVQVNYLGYPGTWGAGYIDYLLADKTVIPEQHRQYYDERIVYLPHSYLVNDSTKAISGRRFDRSELGLPEDAFVFCSFSNGYKITPDLFDIWMRLLRKVENGVLWLMDGNATSIRNLRREAGDRGVASERLVFAPRMTLADHLARHRAADLFLDTFRYNAHTTGSDALWAGLPLLTCLGETFASRVAASLLSAVGLPELITRSPDEYEALALELATRPGRLADLRRKLAANLTTQPLFDTALTTLHIEAAYRRMHARHRAGLPPEHFAVDAAR